ncbi:hypothetical protein BsWGS_25341 [Bradybaena similaris]
MKLANGCEHLLLTALFYFAVRADNRKAVFSILVTSPNNGDISNISFSTEAFQRFYNCLLSSETCTISYTQSYSKKHKDNALHVRGSHQTNHLSANREKRARTSFCTKITSGKLKCQNKAHDRDNHELGVRPKWQCDNLSCPCVYFGNVMQISYDNKDLQECPRKTQISSTFRRLRAKRASRSSSRSSSSRSSSSSSKSSSSSSKSSSSSGGSKSPSRSSSSSNSGSRTRTIYRTSNNSSSNDSKAGMIVGIIIGAIFFVFIVLSIVGHCLSKCKSQNNVESNSTSPETCNEIEMADVIAEENEHSKSQCVFSEMTPDTEFSKQNVDIFPTQIITDVNEDEYSNYEDTREINGKINVTGNEEYVGIPQSEKSNVLIQY